MTAEQTARARGLELFRLLLTTRLVEERLEALHRQGRVLGGLYRSLGQEACAVGAASALERRTDGTGDVVGPSYRGCGVQLTMGAPLRTLFRQHTGRGTSPSRGRDSGAGWTDLDRGLIGSVVPLGTNVEVLAGAALAFQLRGEPRVAMAFTGDGAASTGAWHEGIGVAAARRVPLVLVVENNAWAFSTRSEGGPDVFLRRGPGYGVQVRSVDGTDVEAVRDAADEAVARARAGEGVQLLELRAFRRSPHAPHDAHGYVDRDELAAWEARDPLARLHARLSSRSWSDPFELDAIRGETEAEVERAAQEALAEPDPEGPTALQDVVARPAPEPPWTRRRGQGTTTSPTGR